MNIEIATPPPFAKPPHGGITHKPFRFMLLLLGVSSYGLAGSGTERDTITPKALGRVSLPHER